MTYLVGATHRYGTSYYNEGLRQMGAAPVATRYDSEKAANAAARELVRLKEISHKMSYDGVRYTDVFVEPRCTT